ncbi:Ferulic acid decarboxylase 1 [Fusarium keratoplasticum]|nr:Ferulic acid decarboxylase 1 [Fusarium keratoplasticum]
MATTSPEENSKSSAQSFCRFIRQLQDEYDLVAIDPEVDPRLELAAIVRNVYETEDKAPLFNNVKGRQETASLASWAHCHVFLAESKQCPIFKVNAITYRNDPILPICRTGRASKENETLWGLMQAAEFLTICQDAGLPIKMVWNPFESHCI